MPEAFDPREDPHPWELVSEFAVIVALFGAGMRVDDAWKAPWRHTVRLLVLLMPITIASVALLGWWWGGMSVAAALLLGAVLAPTDPVLAADVQIGPPKEGGEHPVRFSLTTEAGLNDGLTFPFVWFGIFAAAQGLDLADWGLEWLARDVFYRIIVGAAAGGALGWLLGKIIFALPRGNPLAETCSGVVAIAGVLLSYGLTELVEGYGFVAAFVAGLTLRRIEASHECHSELHTSNETVEHMLMALILIMMGGMLPLLWQDLRWEHVAIAGALLLVIRPVAGWMSLAGTGLKAGERAVIAGYGIRGIGSIYYLAFAAGHVQVPEIGALWAIVACTIVLSTLVHGLTAAIAVERVTKEEGA